jgi:hypothetical protein
VQVFRFDLSGLEHDLSKRMAGEVRFDATAKALYAT